MARPINADAEATRKRILEAASARFSEHGLGAATMRQIAGSAEVSLATVHHYFGSKSDLYAACVDAMYSELEGLRNELETAVASLEVTPSSLRAFVDTAVRRACRFSRRHRPAVQLMIRTLLDTGEMDPEKRERYLLPFLERGSELIAPLLGRHPGDVRTTLLALNHLIARFTLSSPRELAVFIGKPSASDEEAIAFVEDYLVRLAWDQLSPRGEDR